MPITRRDLRKDLQSTGEFNYRDARKVVGIILEILTSELKKNKSLNLPFGTMTLKILEPKRLYRLGKIVKVYTKPKVHFRRKD